MTDKEAAQKLKDKCFSGDTEVDHRTADDILCQLLFELGYAETIAIYRTVSKWFA